MKNFLYSQNLRGLKQYITKMTREKFLKQKKNENAFINL